MNLPTHTDSLKDVLNMGNEQNQLYKHQIEKLTSILQERDKKIAELQQFEFIVKKASEKRQEFEKLLEKEQLTSLAAREETNNLQLVLNDSQQHGKQLERVIQFLRERLEEAQLEAKQLKGEFQSSHESIESFRHQIDDAKEREEELNKLLQLEKIEKQEVCDELSAIQLQFENLKSSIFIAKDNLIHSEEALEQTHKLLESVRNDKTLLENELADKENKLKSKEQEIEFLKKSIAKGYQDSRELESRYQEATNEKNAAINKTHLMRLQVDKQRDEIRLMRDQLTESMHQTRKAHEQREELRLSLEEIHQKNLDRINDKVICLKQQIEMLFDEESIVIDQLHIINALKHKMNEILIEKSDFATKLEDALQVGSHAESQVKIAHQHLAKKMKDMSALLEKLEEQKIQISELQSTLSESNNRCNESQSRLQVYEQQEMVLQDKFESNLKAAEFQITKWEEKYSQMHAKWQHVETQNKELRALEEKHMQIQLMLNNLGAIMRMPAGGVSHGQTQSTHQTANPMPISDTVRVGVSTGTSSSLINEVTIDFSKEDQPLFAKSESPIRYRQTLFE